MNSSSLGILHGQLRDCSTASPRAPRYRRGKQLTTQCYVLVGDSSYDAAYHARNYRATTLHYKVSTDDRASTVYSVCLSEARVRYIPCACLKFHYTLGLGRSITVNTSYMALTYLQHACIFRCTYPHSGVGIKPISLIGIFAQTPLKMPGFSLSPL